MREGGARRPAVIRTWQAGARFFWEVRRMFYYACGYFMKTAQAYGSPENFITSAEFLLPLLKPS